MKGTKSIVLPNCLRKINKFVVILQVLELPEYEFLHLNIKAVLNGYQQINLEMQVVKLES